ncbi:MAG: HD domain-containing protein [Pirellulales bacterium]|nr:HD domain-containing protein [Pirellulales bacterium]
MPTNRLRRQIAWEAARLMYARDEAEYFRAKMKAARRICSGDVKPSDLPSNREIRDQIQALARMHEGRRRSEKLREMRVAALRMMRILRAFRPRLIGSTMTGHVRKGSDIDLHVFSDSVEAVAAALDAEGVTHHVERKRVRKQGSEQTFVHIHATDCFPFELTIYASNMAHYVFKSSITGKAIERASIAELEQLLEREHPDLPLEEAVLEAESKVDRFQIYEMLLLPLEQTKEGPKYHPEGDVLYHSLQVFDLVRNERPYDEELLLAALLHDVGKGIDRQEHIAAGLEALGGFITPRTAWLIEHHMEAHALREGTLGVRARRRLESSEDFEDLRLLAACDDLGRVAGVAAPDVDEALEYLRELADMCDR